MNDRTYVLPERIEIGDVEVDDRLNVVYDSNYSDENQEVEGRVESVSRRGDTGSTHSFELWADDGDRVLHCRDLDNNIATATRDSRRQTIGRIEAVWRLPPEVYR